ncbi:hypothetical protein DL98DRAFT_644464 [Cadophora sp. DSE1049]|nr:hypothetical protein DL98DRAFT_644464 [Cadophora sp. DSE1049]
MTSPAPPPPPLSGKSSRDNAITSDSEITTMRLTIQLRVQLEDLDLGPRDESSRVPQGETPPSSDKQRDQSAPPLTPDTDQSEIASTSEEQTAETLDPSEQQSHDSIPSADGEVNDFRQPLGDREDSVVNARQRQNSDTLTEWSTLDSDSDSTMLNTLAEKLGRALRVTHTFTTSDHRKENASSAIPEATTPHSVHKMRRLEFQSCEMLTEVVMVVVE